MIAITALKSVFPVNTLELQELAGALTSDGSGSKIFDPGRVNFLWLESGRVSHLWFESRFGKFPLKISNFSIFFPSGQKKLLRVGSESTRVKAWLASYLLRVKSKLGSGQGPSLALTHPQGVFWAKNGALLNYVNSLECKIKLIEI